jgi:hypothetical protein
VKNRQILTAGVLAAFVTLLTGCWNNVSQADEEFVAATMPAQFESFGMYNEGWTPSSQGSGGASSIARQGCWAIIHAGHRETREAVVLENVTGRPFNIDAKRTASGWTVTSQDIASETGGSTGFREFVTSCVNAIQDKFRANPESAPF